LSLIVKGKGKGKVKEEGKGREYKQDKEYIIIKAKHCLIDGLIVLSPLYPF
jgi:hypothetical protein